MEIGAPVDESGRLRRLGGGFVLERDCGGRLLLDLRRTPIDLVEKHVRVTGTCSGDQRVDVDGVRPA